MTKNLYLCSSLCHHSLMGKNEKILDRILRGTSDANIRFNDLCSLLKRFGFEERMQGSHHIFRRQGIIEKPNLQRDGTNAKTYQVRQVRNIILKYGLTREIDG